ncbi:putative ankyrin and het domain protein [Phaeomoniella chlamydospora]|uniref:Putative ankyrin and het domain protein n=1 Tax=Phaeomoniella chlamydospora TaxID=158046 RepID=A0A0G2HJ92_PHACM|nr:putative ankyrin and het domain protein [Phaeomoniella chlamydospora]
MGYLISNKWGSLCYADGGLGFFSPRGTPNEDKKDAEFIPHVGFLPCDDLARRQWDAKEIHRVEVKRMEAEKALEVLPPFKHPPLPSASDIRLLRIGDSNDTSDILRCSLVVVDLKKNPAFDALSYTWGNPFAEPRLDDYYDRSTSIICNGQVLRVKQNLLDALRRLRKGSSIEKRGSFHKTPLIKAAEDGHTRLVQALLLQGADFTSKDCFGETALHYAAENGHLDVVSVLVHVGSSLTVLDKSRRTALDCAKQRKRVEGKYDEIIQVLESRSQQDCPSERSGYFGKTRQHQQYIWVDAICINQEDNIEKSAQVALMGKIYQSAKSVTVWLGRERQDNSDSTAEDLLLNAWRLDTGVRDGKLDDEGMKILLEDPKRHLAASTPQNLKSAIVEWLKATEHRQVEKWMVGVPFFQRRWFERGWIIQELIVAKYINVVCGQFMFPWDMLVFVACVVNSCVALLRNGMHPLGEAWFGFSTIVYRSTLATSHSIRPHELPVIALERRRRAYQQSGPLSSMAALMLGRNALVQDQRDKVFSVLSISSPIQYTKKMKYIKMAKHHAIAPDYVQSSRDLYIDVAKSLIETYGPCVLSLVRHSSALTIAGLPSWVPDLTVPIHHRPLGIPINTLIGGRNGERDEGSRYNAARNLKSSSTLQITPENHLTLQALYLDTVDGISLAGLNDVKSDLSGLVAWRTLLSGLPHSIERKREILWRTMILNEVNEKHLAPNLDEQFIGWLKFMCYVEMLDNKAQLTKNITRMKDPVDALYPQRPEESMLRLLENTIQQNLAFFGITFTDTELQRWRSLSSFTPKIPEFTTWYANFSSRAGEFGRALHGKDTSGRIFRTRNKLLIGMGPEQMQKGDMVYIIPGTTVPYILRPDGGSVKGLFRIIGEAYVHEIMHGEAVEGLKGN